MVDFDLLRASNPAETRRLLGDGNFGGAWQREDDVTEALWRTGVEETRAALEGPWPD
jgi:creatinine amidohydrolase